MDKINSSAIRFHSVNENVVAYAAADLIQRELAAAADSRFGPYVIVIPDLKQGEALFQDLSFYLKGLASSSTNKSLVVRRLPAWEVLPFDALSPATEVSAERLSTLSAFRNWNESELLVCLTTVRACMQRVFSPAQLAEICFEVSEGARLRRDDFVERLISCGYVRTSIVEEIGQLAVRGAVVDFFPPNCGGAVRVEYFGEEIDSIRSFDPATQRSIERLKQIDIIPATEFVVAPDSAASTSLPSQTAAEQRLKDRALELELPQRKISAELEAIASAIPCAGIEHLAPIVNPSMTDVFEYFPSGTKVLVFDEPGTIRSAEDFDEVITERYQSARREDRLISEPEQAYLPATEFLEQLRSRARVFFDQLDLIGAGGETSTKSPVHSNEDLRRELQNTSRTNAPLEPLAQALRRRAAQGCNLALSASTKERAQRLTELLEPYGFQCQWTTEAFWNWFRRHQPDKSPSSNVDIFVTGLNGGVYHPENRISLITEAEIFPQLAHRRPRSAAAQSVRRFLGETSQLSEDDYVVHIDHGIGIYRGLKQIAVHGVYGDFLHLEYADEAKLFLPVENIGKVQKYVGVEGRKPTLTKLGSKNWEKSKAKVKERVAELAGQLINLYAERQLVHGISFGQPSVQDAAFADSFEFTETPDQERAINDVMDDMASEKPMDRLVCGDVGYGKTEVAVRAAFKAVSAGWQVAILVPTTILADQHYATFSERFASQPFNIAVVSRFSTPQENKETIERVADGRVDIIIGTHRLLQKDVRFKKLGLIVIDEEHRFGVAHKEKLKGMRKEVDVLTLTATPIPRTLHMSLIGIRDLSLIETAPSDRHFVRTYLSPYRDEIVREAIMRELGRGGQVFYIHNRVQTIHQIADEVRALIPEARIEVAHGQMKDKELEAVMHRFVQHEFDVLVSTTIVESGLDISNANTIIIRKADHFGLAELYQLRGRVGRSSRRAYAYMLISDPKTLGPDAKKRLAVLQSLDDLGQGFRLALQDMEIRGAGNLLGKDQSGQVNDVGFELYSKILREAVDNLRAKMDSRESNASRVPDVDPEISIGFPAYIPRDYIPDVAQRLILYQRLAALDNKQAGLELAEEIEDRFGRRPEEVDMFIELMTMRAAAKAAGIAAITFRENILSFSFHPEMAINAEDVMRLVASSAGKLSVTPNMTLKLRVETHSIETPADLTNQLMKIFKFLDVGLGRESIVNNEGIRVESP
ncbi:MAG: transcription-repair coupling factor [Bdellovibrionales bacterium]|nr:transcription-repair coupling factor [Bdellovibrionales bacterium]